MSMFNMLDQVRDFMDRDDWHYEFDAGRNAIIAGVSLKCKLHSLKLFIVFNERGYTCMAVCPMKADEETRAATVEYITRANYGLRNGNFEVDMNDGEIRYKCYVNFHGLDNLP